MVPPAFYLPKAEWPKADGADKICVLTGAEARHAQVVRLRPGDPAHLFDGEGCEAPCCVVALDKRCLRLRVEAIYQHPLPVSRPVIALALSKATRRGFFMEKAVELAAHEIWLWQAEHSQGMLPPHAKESWQGQLIAGLKQCRNPWLPVLRVLGDVQAMIAQAAHAAYKILPWELPKGHTLLSHTQVGQAGVSVYAIGPEGGFSQREIDHCINAGFIPVSLGQRVLRCETAALLCLGLHYWATHTLEIV